MQLAQSRGVAAYQNAQVGSASPVRIIVLLYDGAIRFLHQAAASDDPIQRSHQAGRAHRIVAELLSALDRERGGEIAANLDALYRFVLSEITRASLADDRKMLQRLAQILEPLGSAWSELAARGTQAL